MTDLITPRLVRLDADLGADKEAVIRSLAGVVADAGRTGDTDQLIADAMAREATSATGLPGGIAIPHCRTPAVDEPTLAFARLAPGVEFGAKDGPADLVFLIAAPAGGDATHLKLLTQLARALVKADFTNGLRAARTPERGRRAGERRRHRTRPDAGRCRRPRVGCGRGTGSRRRPARRPAGRSAWSRSPRARPASPTPTWRPRRSRPRPPRPAYRSWSRPRDPPARPRCPARRSSAAGAVIFAVDVGVRDRSRFAGKPVVSSGVKRPIDDADSMIAEAVRYANDPNAPRVEGSAGDAGAGGSSAVSETWGGRTRRVLMTGVSYMIPFVAAGGLLIALGFLFGGDEIVNVYGKIAVDNTLFNLPNPEALGLPHALFNSGFFAYLGALFFIIGKTAFIFFVPALAGYIAYAIADRPGIAPGFVMGGLAINVFGVTDQAATNPVSLPATGFLGAILGGVLAGVVAHWITGWKVPAWARGLMPVLVIPLLTCIICGLVMIIVLGKPIGNLISALEDGLNSMSGSNAILLGIVLGLMMAFDMGGPLNKVAYSFAAAGVGVAASAPASDPRLQIMAAVMLAGMVPPIALALATVVRPHLFNIPERENGKAGWLLGASFITEGAIPFAAADPLRVIPPIMLGSAVTGAASMAFNVSVRAPHGGIFVLFAVHNILGYFIALILGVVVGAAAVIAAKTFFPANNEDLATV